ncbi:hypothetical protein [Paenibacillus sp. N3/727]|uniref:CDI toxin immunity protein n=1 Tax=Paenibacillus sp. N3/727 TaxID=2925845 RepID=UPI00321FEF1A
MNRDRRLRSEQLLHKQKSKQRRAYGALFEECIYALGPGTIILSEEKSQEAYNLLDESYPVTSWSRIDWEKVSSKKVVGNVVDMKSILFKQYGQVNEDNIFILWNYGDFPVLETQLFKAINSMDDVVLLCINLNHSERMRLLMTGTSHELSKVAFQIVPHRSKLLNNQTIPC